MKSLIEELRVVLLASGWQERAELQSVLEYAQELKKEKGITDLRYLEKLLRRHFPKDFYTLRMGEPAPLELAIEAVSKDEQKNVAKAKAHLLELLRSPVAVSGSLMPDACPAGNELGLPVGGVYVTQNAIVPAGHSSDICCSMYASFYYLDAETSIEEELEKLREVTRFGSGGRSEPVPHPVTEENVWNNPFLKGLKNKAIAHIADQGDGNHFAYLGELEVQQDFLTHLIEFKQTEIAEALSPFLKKTVKVLVTHHGSRGLGATVYKRGLEAAVKHTRKIAEGVPPAAAWVDAKSAEGQEYWQALQYVSHWTKANHQSIHQGFLQASETAAIVQFGNEHNFVWQHGDLFYHGKGATPAWLDKAGNPLLGLIPLNMAQPILLVLGKNNKRFHSFAPHGAGRNLSRSALLKHCRKQKISIADAIRSSTQNIAVHWYQGQADLTECPIAYKNADQVIQQIEQFELAQVIARIQPRGCIMAGRSDKDRTKDLTPKQKRQLQHRATRRKNKQRDWSDNEEFY